MKKQKLLIPIFSVICFTALCGGVFTSMIVKADDDVIVREPTVDNISPFMELDDNLHLNDLPVGQVNVFYPFWEAKGYDAKGEYYEDISENIVHTVYYGDEKLDGIEESLGGFIPSKTGTYTIVYTLTDEAGNEAEEIQASFEVKQFVRPIEFSLESDFEAVYYMGEILNVPAYTVSGGSGALSTDVFIQNYSNSIDEKLNGTTYFLESTGLYSVLFTVSDYLGTTQRFWYYFEVEYSQGPIIEETVVPKALVAGKKFYYNIPKAYDYSYSGSPTEVPVTVEIAENDIDGTYKVIEDEYYQPSPKATRLYVRYTANAVLAEEQKTVTAPQEVLIIQPETLTDYFHTVEGKIQYKWRGNVVKEMYFQPDDGSKMQFINPVPANKYGISMLFDTTTINFQEIALTLLDSVNPLEVLTVTLSKASGSELKVFVNGKSYKVNGLIDGECKAIFALSENTLTVNGMQIFLSFFDTGKDFSGFSSGKVYTKFHFIDVEDGKNLRLAEFLNIPKLEQTDQIDIWSPILTLNGSIPALCDMYSYVELPSAIACDMLDSDCKEVKLTLRDPNNNVLLNAVDASTVHTIRLELTGRYSGEYIVTDAAGVKAIKRFSVYSRDMIAPKIEIDGQIRTTAKIGDKLEIPQYYVYDNLTEKLTPYVYLITPTFAIKTVSKDGVMLDYTFSKAGKYTLRFWVFDEDYNETVREFVITVTE